MTLDAMFSPTPPAIRAGLRFARVEAVIRLQPKVLAQQETPCCSLFWMTQLVNCTMGLLCDSEEEQTRPDHFLGRTGYWLRFPQSDLPRLLQCAFTFWMGLGFL